MQRSLHLNSRLPLGLLAVLVLVQLFNPARIWMSLILGLGAMLGLSYLWARVLRDQVLVSRALRGTWVLVGDVLSETFVIENRSSLPLLWAEVVDRSELPGYHPGWVATLDPSSRQVRKTTGRCQRRGVFRIGPWELHTADPLGFFSVILTVPDSRSVLVYPRAMRLPDLQLPRGEAAGSSRISRRTPQFTASVASVRPYAPGDSLRRIHWRHTAHHDEFMVKEFDLEPSGDLWLVLDIDDAVQAGEGAESTLEYGVTLVASLAAQMIAENRRVGLVTATTQILPQAGQVQLWRILEVLAHADPQSGAPLARVLREMRDIVGRGRTVVVITPSADPQWPAELLHLVQRGNAPAALLLDAPSFQDGIDPGVAADATSSLRTLLAGQGVTTHVIDRDFDFTPLVRIARTRVEYRTLSATGRVIAVEVEEYV